MHALRSLNKSIQQAVSIGTLSQALEISRRALELSERTLGRDSMAYAVQLQVRAWVLAEADHREDAEKCLLEALQLRMDRLDPDHPAIAAILFNLALLRVQAGRFDEALKMLHRCLEIRTARLGLDHQLTLDTRRAIESCQAHKDNEQPDYEAVDLYNRALDMIRKGQFHEAESNLLAAIDKNRARKGTFHRDTAHCLETLGDLYVQMGNFERAKPLLQEALEICRSNMSETRELRGMVLSILARAHASTGNFDRARELHHTSIRAFEDVENPPVVLLSTALANLGTFEHNLGNLEKAELYLTKALNLLDPLSGLEAESCRAKVLNGLAVIAEHQGDMTKAIRLMEVSVQLKAHNLGEDDLSYAFGADNLAAMYGTIRDSKKAKEWNSVALQIFERVEFTGHPGYLKALLTSGTISRDTGDAARARESFQKVIDIAGARGIEDETVSIARTKLLSLDNTSDKKSTLRTLEEIVHSEQSAVGTSHPRYARALANYALAGLEYSRERAVPELLSMLSEALDILEHTSPPLIQAIELHRLVDEEWRAGEIIEVQRCFPKLARIEEKVLSERLFLREPFEEGLSRLLNSTMSLYISAHLDINDSAIGLEDVLNCTLKRKGHVLESAIVDRRRIVESKYPSVRKTMEKVAQENWMLVKIVMEGPVRRLEVFERLVKAATDACAELTEEAVHSVPLKDLVLLEVDRTYAETVSGLRVGEALLDIVRFDRRPLGSGAEAQEGWYIAFVTVAGRGSSYYRELGRADDMDEMIRQSLIQIGRRSGSSLTESMRGSESFSTLVRVVREMIAGTMTECERLFVAPDGEFWRFPFELLPTSDDGYLIDSLEVIYLSSVRDLIRREEQSAPSKAVVVYDADFDFAGEVDDENHLPWLDRVDEAELASNPSAGAMLIYGKVPDDAVDLGFDRLSGAMAEGMEVAALINADKLTGAQATKRAVLTLRAPRILHIATHGFVLENKFEVFGLWSDRLNAGRVRHLGTLRGLIRFMAEILTDEFRPLGLDERDEGESDGSSWPYLSRAFRDPLIRSGLVLAGANAWLNNESSQSSGNNGLLTAREISYMDLRGTELVVLSGCNTGVSSATTGRGVEGLRRGFLLAGAKSLLVTLWEIPDRETRDLMSHFYRRLCSGEGGSKALRGTKQWMKARHPDPYFWAGFVLHGNCEPLDVKAQNERDR